MDMEELVALLIVGLIAGWLAGQLSKGKGFGLVGNMAVGVVGAFVGQWLARTLEVSVGGGPWVSAIVTATVGALVLLFVLNLVIRKLILR